MMEDGRYAARGYFQDTTLSAAQNLPSIPADADAALIVCATQNCRWRDDGTDPTTTIGQLLVAGSMLWYRGTLANFRIIEVAASSQLNVSYYKAV